MSAEISISNGGVAEMAYANEVPWHGLGNRIAENATIDEWTEQAGLTWTAERAPVHFTSETTGETYYMDDRVVLHRSDTDVPLGIVSSKYQVVQPRDIMEFFRDVVELGSFTMETAGALFGGRKIWALARASTGQNLSRDDVIKPYLLLATSMDGTLASLGMFTTVRVVCNNTLSMAVRANSSDDRVKVTHRGKFNPTKVKAELGLIDNAFDRFLNRADTLASIKVTASQAKDFYSTLLLGPRYTEAEDKEAIHSITIDQLMDIRTNAPGQQTISAKDTAWGLVNGLTYYLDHAKNTHTVDARLNNAWFGTGHNLKQEAVELALEL